MILFPLFATGVVETGGKQGWQIATGVVANLPPILLTFMVIIIKCSHF
jgi:hypothetical protein